MESARSHDEEADLNSTPRRRALGPNSLVPIGSVIAIFVGLFGMARWVGAIETRLDLNVARVAVIEQEQGTAATGAAGKLETMSRDLGELKVMEATTAARVEMIVDHFGIEKRRR